MLKANSNVSCHVHAKCEQQKNGGCPADADDVARDFRVASIIAIGKDCRVGGGNNKPN